jgi:hypothetical protein
MEQRSVGLLQLQRIGFGSPGFGISSSDTNLLFRLANKNLPDPAKPNLSYRFRFDFESEERASISHSPVRNAHGVPTSVGASKRNNQKQKYSDSSARSGAS